MSRSASYPNWCNDIGRIIYIDAILNQKFKKVQFFFSFTVQFSKFVVTVHTFFWCWPTSATLTLFRSSLLVSVDKSSPYGRKTKLNTGCVLQRELDSTSLSQVSLGWFKFDANVRNKNEVCFVLHNTCGIFTKCFKRKTHFEDSSVVSLNKISWKV